MNSRSPSAAFARVARATRSGSLGAGSSPGQSTPRSEPASAPRPSRSRAVAVGEGSAQEVTSSWLHSAVAPGGSADVTCETPGVRVLICPDKFAGTLTAVQAAEAIAAGWSAVAPGDELVRRPLADGGTGFLDVIAAAVGGDEIPVPATDPLGRPVAARVLVAGTTGYVESAQVCGLHLLAVEERDPRTTTSYGLGTLLAAAVESGVRQGVGGLGGSATHHAGAGQAAAPGAPGLGAGRGAPAGRGRPPDP